MKGQSLGKSLWFLTPIPVCFTLHHRLEPQEYWSGQPIPSPVDLPDPGIKPGFPALQLDSLPAEHCQVPNKIKVLCFCLVTKSCSTLCDLMVYSPPGSSVHGVLQARILEWVAIFFSRESSQPRDQTKVAHTGRWILYH